LKLKIKLNHYIFSFFVLIFMVLGVGDTIKYHNYRNTLIQNFTNKHINDTQQIREDFRLLFDKLQYDFRSVETENISKINQLYEIYKRDGHNFNIKNAVDELNKEVSFGRYQLFLINKEYIIEKSSYKNDIGYNLGQYSIFRALFDSMFDKKVAIDISPIKIDSSSLHFKRYLLKLSDDGQYLLQIGFVLDIFKELKEKYSSIEDENALKLYLSNQNFIQYIDFDKKTYTKQSLQYSWEQTKNFISQLSNDLQFNNTLSNKNISTLLNSNINDKPIQINYEIDKLFTDDKLIDNLNLSKHQLSVYSITDGLFNKSIETKLLIETHHSTKELEEDLQITFNQTILQLIIIFVILGLIYLFLLITISNKLLSIINNIKNNKYSKIDNIRTTEVAILNDSYNELHNRLNNEVELNKNLLKDNKRFIADTVHQIRTPLTNIMMNAEMVKKFQTDNTLTTFIDKIDSSINMLSNSYEDLAYVTTADTIEYPPSKLNISEAFKNRINFFTTISKVNYREIIENIEDNIFININAIELERLIDNNISNGIKYATKNKPITLSLLKNIDTVTVEFKTFGDEIINKELVFEKNYRENEAKRGLGLGLNMVKGICEKYNIAYGVTYKGGQNIFSYTFKSQM